MFTAPTVDLFYVTFTLEYAPPATTGATVAIETNCANYLIVSHPIGEPSALPSPTHSHYIIACPPPANPHIPIEKHTKIYINNCISIIKCIITPSSIAIKFYFIFLSRNRLWRRTFALFHFRVTCHYHQFDFNQV